MYNALVDIDAVNPFALRRYFAGAREELDTLYFATLRRKWDANVREERPKVGGEVPTIGTVTIVSPVAHARLRVNPEQAEKRAAEELQFNKRFATEVPKYPEEGSQVRLNVAAILREDALLKRKQSEDTKLIKVRLSWRYTCQVWPNISKHAYDDSSRSDLFPRYLRSQCIKEDDDVEDCKDGDTHTPTSLSLPHINILGVRPFLVNSYLGT